MVVNIIMVMVFYLVLVGMEELSVMMPLRSLVKWWRDDAKEKQRETEKKTSFQKSSRSPYQNVPTQKNVPKSSRNISLMCNSVIISTLISLEGTMSMVWTQVRSESE